MLKSRKIIWIALIVIMLFPASASASEPYDTFYVNHGTGQEWISYMQDVYTTGDMIVGSGDTALNRPADLFVADNDDIYVADTGNNRVVQLDDKGKWIRAIGTEEGPGRLSGPEGVFVTHDGMIYVADTGNQRVVIYNSEGVFTKELKKPDSQFLPESYYFVPVKIVVDDRNVLYAVSRGSYQGLMRIGKEDEFTGFFGGNKSSATLMDRIKRLIFTEEQLEKETAIRPQEVSNVTLSDEGFIFTTTTGAESDQIKQLSAGGSNSLKGVKHDSAQLVDVALDSNQFIYVLDQRLSSRETRGKGTITIYSPSGTELFRFGKTLQEPDQRGILSNPVSIDINSRNDLLVLDSNLNLIQMYNRTGFGTTFFQAATDYYEGDYEKSKANWQEVVEQNELISLIYSGLAEVANKEGNIEAAMEYFKITYDAEGYSEAFWTYRMRWIEKYFVLTLVSLLALWLLYRFAVKPYAGALKRRLPKVVQMVLDDLQTALYTMIHPYDGFYRLKGRNVSYLTLGIIAILIIFVKIVSLYWTGFTFNPINLKAVVWWIDLLPFLAPIVTWIVANYLVSTIKDGEGRFREVFQGSIFAMVPFVVFSIPIMILSNILVLEEKVLISSLSIVMWLWIITLFIVKAQVTHNFEFIENIRNSITTAITIGIIWIFIAVSAGLTFNLWDFGYQLYKEVTFLG
ncbi:hypothetical protein M3223_16985 [Paenibacillus pasadenensis]|uniref:YIP1 family protein n=1 Tax=Paenibacillus pasadenensis TaxID=217090 RepID=UPI00203CAAC8|nr:YIP1 family protein [Paenibacillus pasadenensis]MCM3749053.1 hypothetical protein [Paenibacillus pasadenensis]